MSSSRRRTLTVLAIATTAGAGAGIAIGLDENDDTRPSAGSEATSAPSGGGGDAPDGASKTPEADLEGKQAPPEESDPQGAEPGPSGPAPESTDERAAATAARGYIQVLDRRRGNAVCRAFVPRALDAVAFPKRRPSCAATVDASLGFERRGLPVWQRSQMTDAVSAQVSGDSAKVVATVFTVYADVREPTIEDDVIYLQRAGDRWLVAKPSLTLHRAIGDPDPPLSALAPP